MEEYACSKESCQKAAHGHAHPTLGAEDSMSRALSMSRSPTRQSSVTPAPAGIAGNSSWKGVSPMASSELWGVGANDIGAELDLCSTGWLLSLSRAPRLGHRLCMRTAWVRSPARQGLQSTLLSVLLTEPETRVGRHLAPPHKAKSALVCFAGHGRDRVVVTSACVLRASTSQVRPLWRQCMPITW